jgi:hypothetical protein
MKVIDVVFDETQLTISSELELGPEQLSIVRAVSRAGTTRFIEARATQPPQSADGVLSAKLALHEGWRQEFFGLPKTAYEQVFPLPVGDALYLDLGLDGVNRWMGKRWVIRRRTDQFTGLITHVIDVPTDGWYSFSVESDDGSIGTLQDLERGTQNVRVLWYEWQQQAMDGRLLEVTDQFLARGTYLLTVHYFEKDGRAGYVVRYDRESDAESPPTPDR